MNNSILSDLVVTAEVVTSLGMPSGKIEHHPGWKPLQRSATIMSQARLHARAGSPDPSEGTCKSPSGFHRRDRNEHPPSERHMGVWGGSQRGKGR